MEQNDLAKEYAKNLYHERADGDFKSTADVFDSHDIEDAFNAGRKSVVDNIPKLEWNWFKATTEIGTFSISKLLNWFYFSLDDMKHWKYFDNVEDTMQAANEYYKQRIKKVLGL